jgi:hypothetical protein
MSTGHIVASASVQSRRAFVRSLAALAATTGFARTARTASVTFQDPLMKIFVVSELMRLRRIELGPYRSFHERLLGRPHDTRLDGFRANPAALDYFARLELSADDLAAVEQLHLDGGNSIFPFIDPNWQGYTDGIDEVKRLDDVAQLPNLSEFQASAYLADGSGGRLSLTPFRGLAKLRRIDVTIDDYSDLAALLELPSLSVCSLMGNKIYDDVMTRGHPSRAVMETLRSRGVGIRVHWLSASGPPWPPPFE